MAPALRERQILLDWAAFNFQDQDASPDADAARAVVSVGRAVRVHLHLASRTKRRRLFPRYMVARKHRVIEASRMQMLMVWKEGCGKERLRQMKGWGG